MLRKVKTRENEKKILERFNQDFDERDIWMGIRYTGQDYKVKPYSRKTKTGRPIPPEEIAEESAKYLANEQWKEEEGTQEIDIGRKK